MNWCFYFIAILFFITSCKTEEKSEKDFSSYISTLDTLSTTKQSLFSEFDVEPIKMQYIGFDTFIITTNGPEWGINVIDNKGNLIDHYDEILGRGPGQVEIVNDLSIHDDYEFSILDKSSRELEFFFISEGIIEPSKTVLLPDYYPMSLQSYFIVKGKKYGVFRDLTQKIELNDNTINSTDYFLFSINEDFTIGDRLIKFGGNEVIEGLRSGTIMDNPIGFKTRWKHVDNKFYYANSKTLNISIFDINTFEKKEYIINDIPKRYLTINDESFLKDKFKLLINRKSSFEKEIYQGREMPLFYDFFVSKKYIVYQIYNYTNNNAKLLLINNENMLKEVVEVPARFLLRGITDTGVYGVNYEEENTIPIFYEF